MEDKEENSRVVSEQVGQFAVGYLQSRDVLTTASESRDAQLLEKLFAEIDAIHARIAESQKETRRLERENQSVLSELGEIVARL